LAVEGGEIAFRADCQGRPAIFKWSEGQVRPVADAHEFETLGFFPAAGYDASVVFAGVKPDGQAGIFIRRHGCVEPCVVDRAGFRSFRGALVDASDRVIFFATGQDGALGVFVGPDSKRDRLLWIGQPMFGSSIAEFALNPVSINRNGDIVLRIRLENGQQHIVRAFRSP
jgi:hypothetical protein